MFMSKNWVRTAGGGVNMVEKILTRVESVEADPVVPQAREELRFDFPAPYDQSERG